MVSLFHTIYLLHIIFSSVLSHISPEMHEVSVNIKQIIRISTQNSEKTLFSVASVHGNGNPCTDAVVFAVASPVWGSVGQRNGDSMYLRITTVTLQDIAVSVPPEDDIVCKADFLSPVFLRLKDGIRISFRIWE